MPQTIPQMAGLLNSKKNGTSIISSAGWEGVPLSVPAGGKLCSWSNVLLMKVCF